jgi:CRISPR/Cas system endoribonuclease Cas6 (RAMP superfamily)
MQGDRLRAALQQVSGLGDPTIQATIRSFASFAKSAANPSQSLLPARHTSAKPNAKRRLKRMTKPPRPQCVLNERHSG